MKRNKLTLVNLPPTLGNVDWHSSEDMVAFYEDLNSKIENHVHDVLFEDGYIFSNREEFLSFLRKEAVIERSMNGDSVLKIKGKRVMSWNDGIGKVEMKTEIDDKGNIIFKVEKEFKFYK